MTAPQSMRPGEAEAYRRGFEAAKEMAAVTCETVITSSPTDYDQMDTDCYQDTADRCARAIRDMEPPA